MALFDIDYDIDELRAEIEALNEQLDGIKQTLTEVRASRSGNTQLKSCDQAANVSPVDDNSFKSKQWLQGHFGKIYTLHWNPTEGNETQLLSASQDGTMIVWNALRGLKNQIVRLECQWVMACSYSADGKSIACGGLDNNISMYPVKVGHDDAVVTQTLSGHDGYISSIRFISDTQCVSSAGDATCILWDVPTATAVTVFAEHVGDVMSVAIADKNTFFSGATDQLTKYWDIREGDQSRCVRTFEGHDADVNAVVAFPDGYSVITGSDDNSCKLFDTRSWSMLNSYLVDQMHSVTSVDVSKSGRLLFAGYDDCSVQVWDVVRAERVDPVLGSHHENRVACLALNSEGLALATGSWDETMRIYA